MIESVLARKITQVKPNKMLLLVEISMKIQTKIQNQRSISLNTLIMFFNERFSCQHLGLMAKEKTWKRSL